MTEQNTIRDRLNTLTSRANPRDNDEEAPEDLGVCGWLHGIKDRALMLELRYKTGNIRALGYAWLEQVEYDPTEGITLHFVNVKIRLKGRNLRQPLRTHLKLFDGLLRHRIPWIQEVDLAQAAKSGDQSPLVTEIRVLGTQGG